MQEAIDRLVRHVGYEPEAELRGSFDGSYTPLYQAAYLLGGLQSYSLHKELVDSDFNSNWKFYGQQP